MSSEEKIAIVQADKGGAILVVHPDFLKKTVSEKLQNENLYQKLPKDPTKDLHEELYELWVEGKTKH